MTMSSRLWKFTAAAVASICAAALLGSCAAEDFLNNLPGENANELYASSIDDTMGTVSTAADGAGTEQAQTDGTVTAPTDSAPDAAQTSAQAVTETASTPDSSSEPEKEDKIVAVSAPPNPYAAEYFLTNESDLLKESYRKLYEGVFSYQTVVELPEKAVTGEEIEDLLNFVLKTGSALDLPGSKYEVFVDSESYVTKVNLTYNHTVKEGMAMYDALMKRVDEIVAEAEPLLTDYDKIKYFHDTIINGCMYDLNAPDAHTAYGALVSGRAVCDGYMKAFQLLCEKANIASVPAYGKSIAADASGEEHIWNKVSCGGEWFNLDVTWDDPVGDQQVLRYDYFLVDDATIAHGVITQTNRFMNVPAATNAYGDYYTRNNLVLGYDNDLSYQFEQLVTKNMVGDWTDFNVDFRCLDKNLFDQIRVQYFTEASDGSKGFGYLLQDYMAPGEALRYTFSQNENVYAYHINVSKG
ncbi:MAG: hypothetical protein K6B74_13190 [Ruminococcus sp.]|nr:hypothetical protein [Ruminococcus sp.]